MAGKEFHFHSDARARLLEGVRDFTRAIRITLGPRSKSVLIQQPYGPPLVCDDGVTIAKQAILKDPVANLGVQMLKQAAEKTADAVGDGTSTSTLLAYTIFSEGVRNVTAGASAVELKRGLDVGLERVLKELSRTAIPIHTKREKMQVATISAHGDETIGDIVAEALEQVGDKGVITVEESKTTDTQLEVVKGLQFDRGYLSHYFVTDTEKLSATLDAPLIFITDRKISTLTELVTLLEDIAKRNRNLLIIAEDVQAEALATLVVNQVRGTLHSVAVKAPGFGERRLDMLEDIAILTGAQVVSEQKSMRLEDVTLEQLGSAESVTVNNNTTTIVGGKGEKTVIDARIKQLDYQCETAKSDYDREKIMERIAKLQGGVAVIRVGAPVESEMKKKKDAIEDAIASTRAAVAEGILPGGGLALLQCIKLLNKLEKQAHGDRRTGLEILTAALAAPARQIAEKSGVDGGVTVEKMMSAKGNIGFDAATNTYVDLIEHGIVDPAQVVRVALENAVSVAGTLLLTEATMTDIPDEPDVSRVSVDTMYDQ